MNLLDELAHTDIDPAMLAQVRALFEQQQAQLAEKDFKITALTHELAYLKRIRYGKASEVLTGEQRSLFDEAVDMDLAAIEGELENQASSKPARKRAGRQALPPELPRIEHRHEPASCACGQCGANLVKIGEDVSEQLDVEPARFFVHRHIRPQYACRACDTVTAAPVPPAVIDGGLAAPGLLAWVAASKYLDHLPLYRIEQIAARQGVPLARSTLAQWIGRIGVALQPLAERLAELLRQRACLHADETPVRELDPGSGKIRQAYLWAYRSGTWEDGPPIVVFDYQSSRAGAHARAFLRGWRGHLMVDDYAGYKALFVNGLTELALPGSHLGFVALAEPFPVSGRLRRPNTERFDMLNFKGMRFPIDVILVCIRWYAAYPLSYRHLEEMMQERGVSVDHSSINRWAIRFLPVIEKLSRQHKRKVGTSWRMDETYIKVKGTWKYLYRAVDKQGKTVDFLLAAQRDMAAAKRFFDKAMDGNGVPDKVAMDKSGANKAAIDEINGSRSVPITVRQVKYLNNIVEQDHRAIKRVTKPMLGFKSFRAAGNVIAGVELMHMIRKGQFTSSGAAAMSPADRFYALAGQIRPV